MVRKNPILECQDCGAVLRYLTPAEAQEMADNPYNFIAFCTPCAEVNERIERLHDYGAE